MSLSMNHHSSIGEHTSDQIFKTIGINPKNSDTDHILFYYSFGILNHYDKRELRGKGTKEIISFIKEHAISDLRRLNYHITEEMFKIHVEESLKSRLTIDKNPSILMTLLDNTREAAAAIQNAMRH